LKILILSTWFPYPLDQGSRIRAYHLIRALAGEHELALISFEDQPIQKDWLEKLQKITSWIKILPEKPFHYTRWRTFLGLFSIKPAAVVAGYNRKMEKLVLKSAREWHPDAVLAFTFVTAPYALKIPHVIRVVDMDNLLTLMLYEEISFARGYIQKLRRKLSYLKFKHYENNIYKPFDKCMVVSELDKGRVQTYTHIAQDQILIVPNGVDCETHRPAGTIKKPRQLIYNGALTYQPNYDAMQYFLEQVFPLVLSEIPDVHLLITGSTKGVNLGKLAINEQVTITGYVDDIRPIISESQLCVVPLRQGAGTRLKILEAMGLGTAVISTSKGAEGLELTHGNEIWVADSATLFAKGIIKLLNNLTLTASLVEKANHTITTKYDWKIIEHNFATAMKSLQSELTVSLK